VVMNLTNISIAAVSKPANLPVFYTHIALSVQ
jgi:hypothetical protein